MTNTSASDSFTARLRVPQEPVVVADDSGAADPPPTGVNVGAVAGAIAPGSGPGDPKRAGGDLDTTGSVVITSRAVAAGSPVLALAEYFST